MRIDGRKNDELRPIKITTGYIKYPEGSVLIEWGNTKVICNATVEDTVPPFLKGKGSGWVTVLIVAVVGLAAVAGVFKALPPILSYFNSVFGG